MSHEIKRVTPPSSPSSDPSLGNVEKRSSAGIACLPREVMLEIFSNLDVTSASTFRSVCKEWNVLLSDPLLWKSFRHRDFGLCAYEAKGVNFQENCIGLYRRYRNVKNGSCVHQTIYHKDQEDKCYLYGTIHSEGKIINIIANLDSRTHRQFLPKRAEIVDTCTGKIIRTFPIDNLESDCVTCFKVAGGKLITGSALGMIRIWEIDTGECSNELRNVFETPKPQNDRFADAVVQLIFCENKLVSLHYDGNIRVWDNNQLQFQCDGAVYPIDAINSQSGFFPKTLTDGNGFENEFCKILCADNWLINRQLNGYVRVVHLNSHFTWSFLGAFDIKSIKYFNGKLIIGYENGRSSSSNLDFKKAQTEIPFSEAINEEVTLDNW